MKHCWVKNPRNSFARGLVGEKGRVEGISSVGRFHFDMCWRLWRCKQIAIVFTLYHGIGSSAISKLSYQGVQWGTGDQLGQLIDQECKTTHFLFHCNSIHYCQVSIAECQFLQWKRIISFICKLLHSPSFIGFKLNSCSSYTSSHWTPANTTLCWLCYWLQRSGAPSHIPTQRIPLP